MFPPQETERLAELYRYEVLDTAPEKTLDDLVHLAAYICQAPIAVISLVDSDRQWFKSKIGLTATQTDRVVAFCAYTILSDELFVVPDALADKRFVDNPLVIGEPRIRFYCGAPLMTPDGHRIGTLSVIDRVSRELSQEQSDAMRVLSRQVMDHLNLDRRHKELLTAVGERLKSEQALVASQTKFQRLSDCTSSGIYIYSGERFLYANPAAQTITGYSLEELKSLSLWDLVHPDFHEALKARVRAVEAGDQAPARFEFPIIAKDRQIRWLDFAAASIEFDGQPARIGTAIDVTGRKQAEALNEVQRHVLEMISRSKPLPDVMHTVIQLIEALSDQGVCTILLVDPVTGTLRHGATSTMPEDFCRAVDGAPVGPQVGSCGTAVYRKATVIVTDIASDPLWAPWTEARTLILSYGFKACASIPILDSRGEVLGTYAMYYRSARGPTGYEAQLLQVSSFLLGIALDRQRKDEALRVSEERMDAILSNSPLMVFVKDRAGRYLFTNRMFEQRFRLSHRQAIGQTDAELFAPDQAAAFQSNDEKVLRSGMPMEFEESARYDDGSHTSIVTKFPLRQPDGTIYAVGSIVTDITERRKAEEQARRWEQVFAKSGFGLAYGNIVDNTLVAVNEAFARQRGYTVAELVGKPIISVYAPEVREEMKAHFQEIDRLGHFTYESVHQRKDGTTFPVLMEVTVIKDAQGEPLSRVAYALDITERQRAQRATQESEERFRLVAEVTNDVLWDWDLITNNHWWSPNAREKFGYDPLKEPSIEAWRSRLHPRDRRRVLRHVDECLRARDRAFFEEYQFRMADGSYGTFWDKGQVVYDAERKQIRMIGAMIDITAAKRAYASLEQAYTRLQWLTREVQRAEEKERRRLSRELHDEFGQLLSALRLSLARVGEELAKGRGTKDSVLSKNLLTATKTAEHLFVSLRHLVHGLRPAVLDEFGLVVALESMAEDMRQAAGLGCRLSTEPDNVDALIEQEMKGALYRIAQELLTNVVRHAEATKAVVTLRYADGTITLTVQDDGQGGCRQTAGKYGLRGIRERTELLGGELKIRSDRRRGTAVTVIVPVEPLGRNQRPVDSVHPFRMRKPKAQPYGQ